MVATDSYRLSVKETALEAAAGRELRGQRPGPGAAGALPDRPAGRRGSSSRSRCATTRWSSGSGGATLSSRLIDGQFPNYRQLLPEAFEHELRMPVDELLEVVRRIRLLAQKNAPLRLAFADRRAHGLGPDAGRRRGPRDAARRPSAARRWRSASTPSSCATASRASHAGGDVVLKLISPLRPGLIEAGGRERLPLPHHADPAERVSRRAMLVTRLSLRDFRSYAAAELRLEPGITVVHGPNGAGKTNLLEALYVGCTGRSCRTSTERELVRFGATVARVECAVEAIGRPARARRSARAREAQHVRVDGGRPAPARRADPTAGHRVPARTGSSWSRARRRCAARTSTRSSPRCGRRARRRAAPTARRWPSATRCSPGSAPGRRRPGSLPTWDAELGRHGIELMADRREAVEVLTPRFARTRGRARARRRAATRLPTALDGDHAQTELAAELCDPPDATWSAASPVTDRTATTCASPAPAATCAPTAPRASSGSPCSPCCWPSARRSPRSRGDAAAHAARRRHQRARSGPPGALVALLRRRGGQGRPEHRDHDAIPGRCPRRPRCACVADARGCRRAARGRRAA